MSPKERATGTEPATVDNSSTFELGNSRYTTGETYPEGEESWDLKESAVYPNITGADLDQVQQAIDTLLNFAPLTELATAVDDAVFAERERKEFRSVIAERYLAQENFAEAKKFMAPDDFKIVAANLEKLTLAAAGPPQEKAEDMARLGDAWADARGKLLRAPLDTIVHFLERHPPLDALRRRAAGELNDILFQHLRNKGAAAIAYLAEHGANPPAEAPAGLKAAG